MANKQFNSVDGYSVGNANVVIDSNGNISGNAITATANITAPQIISNVATGTSPLVVSSTTQVANLNAATAGTATSATNAAALLQNTSTATTVYPMFTASSANGNSSAVFNTSIVANLSNASISATTFVGRLVGNVANGTSTISIPATNGNINLSSAGNANILVVTGTGANITGTANVTGNLAAGNISANIANFTTANITGNLTAGNITTGTGTGGNISGANVISANFFTGTLTTAAQPNITSVGTLSSLTVSGNANVGNIGATNGVFSGGVSAGWLQNGNSNITVNASSNVIINAVGGERVRVTSSGANITGTLNVSGNANVGNIGATQGVFTNVSGNGSSLSSITGANVTGEVAYAATANSVAGANVSGQVSNALVAGTVYTAAQPNITSVGTLSSLGVSGDISGNNLSTTNKITAGNGLQVSSGTLTVTNGNLDVTGNINVTGNLNYSNVTDLVVGDPLIYIGANNTGDTVDLGMVASYNNGTYQHTGIARNSVTDYWTFFDGVVAEPTTVIDWANATYPTVKMGNLITTANANIGGIANITGNAIVGGTLSVSGNANVGNIGANTAVITTSNITTINSGLLRNGNSNITINANGIITISATGTPNEFTITSTGVNARGYMNVFGNVISYAFSARGPAEANLSSAAISSANAGIRGAANTYFETDALANSTMGNVVIHALDIPTIDAFNANVTATNAATFYIAGAPITAGTFNITNPYALHVASGNSLFSGNVTVGNIIGNGQALASITGANVTGQVANSLVSGTVYTAAQPNITSVGTLTSLTVSGTSNLGPVSNVTITGGSSGQVLTTNGSGVLSWTNPAAGAYVYTQSVAATTWTINHNLGVQYVNIQVIDSTGNSFTGRYNYPTITFNNTTHCTVTFDSAQAGFAAVTSGGGQQGPQGPAGSLGGSNTQIQFNDNGTANATAGFTFDKTTNAVSVTGNVSAANFVGNLANGTSDINIPVANGNINFDIGGTSNVFVISSGGAITSANLADAVGYKGMPQNSQTASYTLALSDMGKHISITAGGVVIPANGSVAFPIGATIVVFNNSASTQSISITTDTLRQAGTTNTGTRTLAAYGLATLVKVSSTVWVISGNVT